MPREARAAEARRSSAPAEFSERPGVRPEAHRAGRAQARESDAGALLRLVGNLPVRAGNEDLAHPIGEETLALVRILQVEGRELEARHLRSRVVLEGAV